MKYLASAVMGLALMLAPCHKREEPKSERCEEDMDCWDCETMGNLVCGPPPMECDGDPADPLHCSAAHGETVCDTQPEPCEP